MKSLLICVLGCFGEKRECLQKMLSRGEVVARCRSDIRHRSRHSQFWGWRKVVPVCGVMNLSNWYSTGIPWSKRNKLDSFPYCVHAAAATVEEQPVRRLHWTELFSQRECLTVSPNYCCPERWFGLNRISHPDWVKLCVELNYAPNKNTKIPSATDPQNQIDEILLRTGETSILKFNTWGLSAKDKKQPIVLWGKIWRIRKIGSEFPSSPPGIKKFQPKDWCEHKWTRNNGRICV